MALLAFGEYRPDVSDLNREYTSEIENVLPRADGYGPVKELEPYTDALAANCRGFFFARNADATVTIFAGTATKLYKLDNITLAWTDVSLGAGTYTSLDNDRNWRFVQFNNYVFATQRNAVLQRFDLTSSSAFAAAPGSPPQAGNIAVVNRFLVLCDLLSNPYRIQWSGLNDTTNWTAGTNFSDYQDLPSGGIPRAIVGGELGVIMQDTEMRRMIYAQGSDIVFSIDRIGEKLGVIGADGVTTANNQIFAYTTRGFISMTVDGAISEIGEEKVNRTFLDGADLAAPQYIVAAADPTRGVVMWSYRDVAGSASQFDRLLAYNYILQRWAPIEIAGQYLAPLSRPGLTLEGLDAIAPGALTITGAADNGSGLVRITVADTSTLTTGDVKTISAVGGVTAANGTWTITVVNGTTFDLDGSTFAGVYTSGGIVGGDLDALEFSLDAVSSATLPALALCDTANKIGFLSGGAMEARVETPEQEISGSRIEVNNLRPETDAGTGYASIVGRGKRSEIPVDGTESAIDDDGNAFVLENTRYARARLRIPSGTAWTFATGIHPEFRKAGRY